MSTYVSSLLAILGGVALALVLGRFLGSERRAGTGEFNGTALSLIGAVLLSSFILLTGFQVAGSWSALSTARSGTYDEARALADAYWAAGGLAEPDRAQVRTLLRTYTGDVRTKEFPDLAHGRTSPVAWADLDRVRSAVVAADGTGQTRQAARAAAQSALATVYQTRTDRAAQATARMPRIVWLAVLICGAFLITFPAILGLAATPRHLMALCFVGAAVAFGVVLAAQLDNAFRRPLGVRTGAYALAETRFHQMDTEPAAPGAVLPR